MCPTPPPLVLVVEDCPDTRELLTVALEAEGFRCQSAASGAEALLMVADVRPDALVLDLGLPDIDGYEVCRRLRHDPATHALPILVLTGHATGAELRRAREAGCHEILSKPSEVFEIVVVLRRLMPNHFPPS